MAILVPRRTILAGAIGGVVAAITGCGQRGNNIGIGLITALTAQSAKSGEAITRGLTRLTRTAGCLGAGWN